MDAIEDANQKTKREGWIEVKIERASDLASVRAVRPVKHVTIRDNGVGFDEPNFKSFCKPDSLYKLTRGGKGVGRLVCIQAFHQMQVASVFQEDDSWKTQNSVFQQEAPALAQSIVNGKADWLTEVKLADLRDEYAALAAIQLDQLLDWLTEHFLPALLEKPTWLKSLVVKDGRKERDLTQLVSGGAAWNEPFKVKNYDFSAKCYALKSLGRPDMVRLIAGGRVVDANTRALEHYIPHLEKISRKATTSFWSDLPSSTSTSTTPATVPRFARKERRLHYWELPRLSSSRAFPRRWSNRWRSTSTSRSRNLRNGWRRWSIRKPPLTSPCCLVILKAKTFRIWRRAPRRGDIDVN